MNPSRLPLASVHGLCRSAEHRAEAYFQARGFDRYVTPRAVAKTLFFTALCGACYAALLLLALPTSLFLVLWFLMGACLMRAALSIVEDAARGVVFTIRPWAKAALGFWARFTARPEPGRQPGPASSAAAGRATPLLRAPALVHVTPFSTTRAGHLYPRRYMRLLYPFHGLFWLMFESFEYHQREASESFAAQHPAVHWVTAFASKGYYLFYMLAVPAQVLPVPFRHIALGFALMHLGFVGVALHTLLLNRAADGPDFALPNGIGPPEYGWGAVPIPHIHPPRPGAAPELSPYSPPPKLFTPQPATAKSRRQKKAIADSHAVAESHPE